MFPGYGCQIIGKTSAHPIRSIGTTLPTSVRSLPVGVWTPARRPSILQWLLRVCRRELRILQQRAKPFHPICLQHLGAPNGDVLWEGATSVPCLCNLSATESYRLILRGCATKNTSSKKAVTTETLPRRALNSDGEQQGHLKVAMFSSFNLCRCPSSSHHSCVKTSEHDINTKKEESALSVHPRLTAQHGSARNAVHSQHGCVRIGVNYCPQHVTETVGACLDG